MKEIHTFSSDLKKSFELIKKILLGIFSFLIFSLLLYLIGLGIIAFKDSGKAVVYYELNGIAINKDTFYTSKDKRSIILKGKNMMVGFKECEIIDIENWECKYPDIDASIKMINGQLKDEVSWNKREEQVSPVYFYLLKIINLV